MRLPGVTAVPYITLSLPEDGVCVWGSNTGALPSSADLDNEPIKTMTQQWRDNDDNQDGTGEHNDMFFSTEHTKLISIECNSYLNSTYHEILNSEVN